jgi:hypothetical protein
MRWLRSIEILFENNKYSLTFAYQLLLTQFTSQILFAVNASNVIECNTKMNCQFLRRVPCFCFVLVNLLIYPVIYPRAGLGLLNY